MKTIPELRSQFHNLVMNRKDRSQMTEYHARRCVESFAEAGIAATWLGRTWHRQIGGWHQRRFKAGLIQKMAQHSLARFLGRQLP